MVGYNKIMATKKQLKGKQSELDAIKWTDSEVNGDTCGTYEYCVQCDKETEYPCARAYYAHRTNSSTKKPGEFTANVELSQLAQKLRALRMAKDLTIEQAARRCHVSAKKLFEYENDKSTPTAEELQKLLAVLEKR